MLRASLSLGFLVLTSLFSTASAEAIAKVVALYGSPTASGRALTAGSAIQEHDKIEVGSGNVQILFNDGTKLVIGSRSSLVIEKYLMKGGNTAQNFAINALRGTFRFITGNSAKAAYDIKTANATIGIRGTGFDFWVTKNTGVVVLNGLVRLCRDNKCVDIPAQCHAGIADGTGGHKLAGSNLSQNMRVHLPYILDQGFLRQPFHLNVQECENILSLTDVPQHSSAPPPPCGRACQ